MVEAESLPPLARPGHRLRRWLGWSAGGLVLFVVVALIAFNLSPWPGAWLIRREFQKDGADVKRAMEAHAPGGISSLTDQPYRSGDSDARLDVYFPETIGPGQRLPTVVWTHGGAWISGHKDDAAPYFQLIAARGYVVVSLGYSLAPAETYPTAIHQVNDALAYVEQNAERFHVDPTRIVLAGDSAGAQITSQIATLVTNPGYATELGLTSSLSPSHLRGVILFCGIYDMAVFLANDHHPGSGSRTAKLLRWGTDESIWAYTGSRDHDSAVLRQMSSIDHVTAAFPPTFISGGNADPLTDAQSRPLAAKLSGLAVKVTPLFYPPDHEPGLAHEYQFDLDNADGKNALTQTLSFLRQYTSP